MNPSEMVQWAVGYTLEVVEERLTVLGKRVLRHWYAGCALIGTKAAETENWRCQSVASAAADAIAHADAMLAALDEADKEARG